MSSQAKLWGSATLALSALLVFGHSPKAQSAPDQPAPPALPAPATSAPAAAARMTGAAAWQLLVGNTAVANSRTGDYTEFFLPDGTVKHLDRDGKAAGKWTLEGQKVCFDFPEEDDRSCVQVEVEGAKGAFIDEDASRDTFEILTGNAKNL